MNSDITRKDVSLMISMTNEEDELFLVYSIDKIITNRTETATRILDALQQWATAVWEQE